MNRILLLIALTLFLQFIVLDKLFLAEELPLIFIALAAMLVIEKKYDLVLSISVLIACLIVPSLRYILAFSVIGGMLIRPILASLQAGRMIRSLILYGLMISAVSIYLLVLLYPQNSSAYAVTEFFLYQIFIGTAYLFAIKKVVYEKSV